jgi:hypothetical protein
VNSYKYSAARLKTVIKVNSFKAEFHNKLHKKFRSCLTENSVSIKNSKKALQLGE